MTNLSLFRNVNINFIRSACKRLRLAYTLYLHRQFSHLPDELRFRCFPHNNTNVIEQKSKCFRNFILLTMQHYTIHTNTHLYIHIHRIARLMTLQLHIYRRWLLGSARSHRYIHILTTERAGWALVRWQAGHLCSSNSRRNMFSLMLECCKYDVSW